MSSFFRAAVLALVLGLFAGGPAEAKWLRAETQRFVIYSNGGEFSLRNYAAMLEDFDIVLRLYHNVDQRVAPPRKLDIYLVEDNDQLSRANSRMGKAVAGFYDAGLDDIFAVAIVERRGRENADTGTKILRNSKGHDTLFHEYTHHFVSQYATFPYPGWMVEGLAEYFAPTEIAENRIVVGGFEAGRAYTLGQPWMPMDALLKSQGVPKTWAEFYAQSWLLTHYMLTDPKRREQLEAYKQQVNSGVGSVEAFTATTGLDPKTLTQRLQAYSRGSIPSFVHSRKKLADLPITITELPASADDLLLENQQLKGGVAEDTQGPLLATIRQRAARYPGDRLAQVVLARAEILYGDRARGEQVLEAHLKAQPDDAEALRLMARSRIMAAQDADDGDVAAKLMASARPFLAKANGLEIDNYQTYYYFAQTRTYDADYPNDNTMELLTLANQIAPQVQEITFQTAQAMVLRKQFEEARPLLTALANDPHNTGMADAARTLLRQIADFTGAKAN